MPTWTTRWQQQHGMEALNPQKPLFRAIRQLLHLGVGKGMCGEGGKR